MKPIRNNQLNHRDISKIEEIISAPFLNDAVSEEGFVQHAFTGAGLIGLGRTGAVISYGSLFGDLISESEGLVKVLFRNQTSKKHKQGYVA